MAKVIDFLQGILPFKDFFTAQKYNEFLDSELGRLYQEFPWQTFESFYRRRDRRRKQVQGRPRKFSVRSGLAILILLAYTGVSARKLMEMIKQNIYFQFFIGMVFLPDGSKYDYHIIYDLKKYYSLTLSEIKQLQKELARQWHSFIPSTEGVIMDATVFESNIKWPVMIELMDNVLHKLNGYRYKLGKELGMRLSSKRLDELHGIFRQLITKRRRLRKKDRKLLSRQLVLSRRYLEQVLYQIEALESAGKDVSLRIKESIEVISEILEQQSLSLEGKQVAHIIVSLYKSYIHGIYRGKARQKVEYGLKYHFFMQGGLVFMEYYSNNNFNETVRLKETIYYSWALFGHKPKYIAADKIYQTRSNHRFLKELDIKSNFRNLGRPVQDSDYREQQKQLRSALNKGRNMIEGVFGVLKEHYYTERVRFKGKESEVLMVFLSMVMYNSLRIHKYKRESPSERQGEAA